MGELGVLDSFCLGKWCDPLLSLPLPLSKLFLDHAWLWNSRSSSNCINLVALYLNSSRLRVGFLHRLFTNGLGGMVVTRWCKATSWFKFWICEASFSNISIKVLKVSPFSCLMLIYAMEVTWWGRQVANWTLNLPTSVSKLLMEYGGRWVN